MVPCKNFSFILIRHMNYNVSQIRLFRLFYHCAPRVGSAPVARFRLATRIRVALARSHDHQVSVLWDDLRRWYAQIVP